MAPHTCIQPHCLLKTARDPRAVVPELALTALEGRVPGEGFRPIEPRSVCAECVRAVMEGCRPFPTHAERQHDLRAAAWSSRRERRSRSHERRV